VTTLLELISAQHYKRLECESMLVALCKQAQGAFSMCRSMQAVVSNILCTKKTAICMREHELHSREMLFADHSLIQVVHCIKDFLMLYCCSLGRYLCGRSCAKTRRQGHVAWDWIQLDSTCIVHICAQLPSDHETQR
jgi:hypothetical protein